MGTNTNNDDKAISLNAVKQILIKDMKPYGDGSSEYDNAIFEHNEYLSDLMTEIDELQPVTPSTENLHREREQTQDGDRAISLNVAKEAITEAWLNKPFHRLALIEILECLNKLPPVTPDRPTGKWLKGNYCIICSECGEDYPYRLRNFCPNCGANMIEPQESEG